MAKRKKRVLRKSKAIIKKEENRGIYSILFRYALVFISAIGNLGIFYLIFTPLTVYPVFSILKLFYSSVLTGNLIYLKGMTVEISRSCVAGSAYFLLFMLNMITKDIKVMRRVKIFLFSSFLLLLLNIARIVILSLNVDNPWLFDSIHLFLWYFVSVVYVFIVWVITIRVFKIQAIPFYSDFVYIKNLSKRRRT